MAEVRKIAAILAADVVGYSRLAGADEDRTPARLRALRSDPQKWARSASLQMSLAYPECGRRLIYNRVSWEGLSEFRTLPK